ncbi:uncharacterized protein LOC134201635 [Bombyx mori]|uniref:uncharacterized protein LOC134201635 n=1 Tax=Bombyx mori TaxID=7091 RepID=UPI002ED01719
MRALIASLMTPQKSEIEKIHSTLQEIKTCNNSIEKALSSLTAQYEELQMNFKQFEVQAKKDRDCIATLEDRIEDLQRASRKTNLELKNVPKLTKETKEDLIEMTVNLSKVIDCKIEKNDITDIYRVQNKRSKVNNSSIVVELASTIKKTDFLKQVKAFNIRHKEKICAKHLGYKKEEYMPVFVSEQLTAKAARLHFLARDLAKSKKFKYCWTAYGRVYIRRDENSPIIPIKAESQVNNLMQSS